ncbi:hypothetical protein Angca_000148, partial [Angiostrongylus cantonensis]
NLPRIPMPTFSGDIWEWEEFWGKFEHSVHLRQMDDRLKMNYLLNSLHGKAKTFIKQYEISRESYPMVIDRQKANYGSKQALVNQLMSRLQRAQASIERLEDQEILCETLYSIVCQIRHKGEQVDNTYFQQLLKKFTEKVQGHVLRE